MKTSNQEIASFIAASSDKQPHLLAEKLASFLVTNNISNEINNISRLVRDLRLKDGFIEANIKSAKPLTNALRNDIKRLIKKRYPKSKSINLFIDVDETLIGGVVIDLPGERLDLSVAGRMREFRRAVATWRQL